MQRLFPNHVHAVKANMIVSLVSKGRCRVNIIYRTAGFKLSGTFPDIFDSLPDLQYLFLADNPGKLDDACCLRRLLKAFRLPFCMMYHDCPCSVVQHTAAEPTTCLKGLFETATKGGSTLYPLPGTKICAMRVMLLKEALTCRSCGGATAYVNIRDKQNAAFRFVGHRHFTLLNLQRLSKVR